MQCTLLKTKLHRACVTHSELDYEGSCAIDGELGLKKAKKLDDKIYISQFLSGIGNVHLYLGLYPKAVRKIITAAKTLYIIPTGSLYGLPFEALVTNNDDEPHYLIQDHVISYLSSASLLKTI